MSALAQLALVSKSQLLRLFGPTVGPVAIRLRYGWKPEVVARALGQGDEEIERAVDAIIERLSGVRPVRFEPRRREVEQLDPRGMRIDVLEAFAEEASRVPQGGRWREFVVNGRFDGTRMVGGRRRVA
jgi:hypothetical protein